MPTRKIEVNIPQKAMDWFKGRGISKEVVSRNKIGYGKIYMPQVGEEVNAIQFPYYDGNEIINIKSRDGNKNFRMEKNARRVLYGLNDILKEKTVIVEGEIDKLSCEMAGFRNTISVPDGAPSANTKNYSSKFSFLEAAEDLLSSVKLFIIAVDNDEPGVRLKDELVRRFGAERCEYVEWPEGCKDANDVLQSYGKELLSEILNDTKPVPVDGIFSVGDFQQQILDIYKYGFEKGNSTGWGNIDKNYTVRAGEWSVVTGIPGHGKSEWLDALTMNMAVNHGWSIGMCSLENLPVERHFAKIAEKYIGLPFQETMSTQRMSIEQLEDGIAWAKDHYFFLMPKEDDLSVDGVLSLCKVLVYRHGINGIVIDPWNELDHSWSNDTSETKYISSALSKIRRFARKHRVHVWVVAHPTKMKKEDGKYPPPTPYDISGSAHWRNKADNAITVHRPTFDNIHKEVDIYVQKVRFKEVGRVGKQTLVYDYITGRYHEPRRN
jgi:twinkle protein